jgi:hypothetical protein
MKKINEKILQRSLHNIISDPSIVWQTFENNRLQILSPGNINLFEGPDFTDAAILINGTVRVGDIEFHRKSSEWNAHNHSNDTNFDNVILHIVCDYNSDLKKDFQTLIISEDKIINNFENINTDEKKSSINTLEELQHYALVRLLRKTSESQKILNQNDLFDTLKILTNNYIKNYNSKRRRPAYTSERLKNITLAIDESEIKKTIDDMSHDKFISIPDTMAKLLKTKIYDEGPHLRREIILNSILPLMLCISNEKSRIDLFLWYWSTPSLNQYGLLKRKFPEIPQNYIWQQQGMLEYIRLYGKKQNIVSESIKTYGFAEILSFYKMGNSPFETTKEE